MAGENVNIMVLCLSLWDEDDLMDMWCEINGYIMTISSKLKTENVMKKRQHNNTVMVSACLKKNDDNSGQKLLWGLRH